MQGGPVGFGTLGRRRVEVDSHDPPDYNTLEMAERGFQTNFVSIIMIYEKILILTTLSLSLPLA